MQNIDVQFTYGQGGQQHHFLSNKFDILYRFSTGLMPNRYGTLTSDFHTLTAKKNDPEKILLNSFAYLDI